MPNSKHVDEQPQASAEPPHGLLDNLLEGCQVIDPDFRYLYVNAAAANHGRTTREALLGRPMAEVYPGIEETEMFARLRECMASRSSAQMEAPFTFPDGSIRWFELRFEPVPQGIAILSVHISERKQAEAALQRSVRALTTLSQSNRNLVRAVDEDRFVSDVCRIVVEFGGYPFAWLGIVKAATPQSVEPVACAGIGCEGAGTSSQVDAEWCQPLAERVLATGESAMVRLDATDPQHRRWRAAALARGFASCIALPVQESGECIGALVICAAEPEAFDDDERAFLEEVALDLGHGIETLRARAARMKSLADLDEARTRARAIYDHLPHATFVWRHEQGRFTLVDLNKAAAAAAPRESKALLGRPAREVGHGIPELEQDLSQCVDTRALVRRERDCVLPGAAQQRRMALSYGFIPPDMVLLHAQDLTDQRQTEQQLMAAQRLEAVARLAGGVAHDFNNLLTAILTYSELAAARLEESNPVRRYIEEVHRAGERAAGLTRQLLAFSRRQVLEPQVVNLNDVIANVESMLRRLLGEDIDIEVGLGQGLGNVMADRGQLEQVVMNLAVNARDAMPHGGRLTIKTENIELEPADQPAGPSQRYVRLSIADTGTGMTPETRARIFEPFFTTKDVGKGTGLGLSMVYGIVEQSGGRIETQSEPDRGTTFDIDLPRVDACAVDHLATGREEMPTGTETILVVEDEMAVRSAAERILRSAGYRVLAAANGVDALRLCSSHEERIDLLLTDVVMPHMSGRQLAQRLKGMTPAFKVLFTSGYTDVAMVRQDVLESNTRFMAKPFSVSELTRKVRQVLDEE